MAINIYKIDNKRNQKHSVVSKSGNRTGPAALSKG
jgi:hypothetical protein